MDYYLTESESIDLLSSIRVESGFKAETRKEKKCNETKLVSVIQIKPVSNIWTKASFELTQPSYYFGLYLTTELNDDRLVVANSKTQEYNNSNIFEVVEYMFDSIWLPVIRNEITISEDTWKTLLIPDKFSLIPDGNFSKNKIKLLFDKFDYVTRDSELSGFLYAEFFMGQQPIKIFFSEFYDFCKKYEIL